MFTMQNIHTIDTETLHRILSAMHVGMDTAMVSGASTRLHEAWINRIREELSRRESKS